MTLDSMLTKDHQILILFNIIKIFHKFKIFEYNKIQKFNNNADVRKQDFLMEEKISDCSGFVNEDVLHY